MNLQTSYLGKTLENPFLLASGPPTANAEMLLRAFEAGWAGAVIKTLILEPVNNLHNRFAAAKIGKNLVGFENIELLSERTPDAWFEDIRILKDRFPGKIIIGSIMGDATHDAQWKELALGCQEAGADFLELNFSCPHGYPEKGKGSAIGQSADFSAKITRWLKEDPKLSMPIIPKLTAAVADISYIGQATAQAGADGLSAINTLPSIMGIDLKSLEPAPSVGGKTTAGGYSGPGIKPIALRCISDLVKDPGLPVMACGGIFSGFDAAEFLLMGAPVVQMCTAVMTHGYTLLDQLKKELEVFMQWHEFSTVDRFVGLVTEKVRPFSELDADYRAVAKNSHDLCIGCGTCRVSCMDAGYQAISLIDEKAVVDQGKCSGCSLCSHVCPSGAMEMFAP